MSLVRTLFPALVALLAVAPAAAQEGRDICFRGVSAANAQDLDVAIAKYDECEQSAGLSGNGLRNLYTFRAEAYVRKGDFAMALADHDRAIALDPNNAYAYLRRGSVYLQVHDDAAALADFDRAAALEPDNSRHYIYRGAVLVSLGQRERGAEDFSRAIELEPSLAEAYYRRGLVRLSQGDRPAALDDLSFAALHLPTRAEVVRQAQELVKALGQDPGPADGRLGANTRTALEAWRKDRGLVFIE